MNEPQELFERPGARSINGHVGQNAPMPAFEATDLVAEDLPSPPPLILFD